MASMVVSEAYRMIDDVGAAGSAGGVAPDRAQVLEPGPLCLRTLGCRVDAGPPNGSLCGLWYVHGAIHVGWQPLELGIWRRRAGKNRLGNGRALGPRVLEEYRVLSVAAAGVLVNQNGV